MRAATRGYFFSFWSACEKSVGIFGAFGSFGAREMGGWLAAPREELDEDGDPTWGSPSSSWEIYIISDLE